jgi:hypothetical protein
MPYAPSGSNRNIRKRRKQLGFEAEWWGYTSIPPDIFMAWRVIH